MKNNSRSVQPPADNRKISIPPYSPSHSDLYSLVFCNFPALMRKAGNGFSSKNEPDRSEHLNFIIQSCSNLSAQIACPCCHKNMVKYFRVKGDHLVPCCSNPKCSSRCSNGLYPLSFEVLGHQDFQESDKQKQLKQLFKNLLGLPENPEPEKIYYALKKNVLA